MTCRSRCCSRHPGLPGLRSGPARILAPWGDPIAVPRRHWPPGRSAAPCLMLTCPSVMSWGPQLDCTAKKTDVAEHRRYSATSAYSSTGPPVRPGYPSSSRPTISPKSLSTIHYCRGWGPKCKRNAWRHGSAIIVTGGMKKDAAKGKDYARAAPQTWYTEVPPFTGQLDRSAECKPCRG